MITLDLILPDRCQKQPKYLSIGVYESVLHVTRVKRSSYADGVWNPVRSRSARSEKNSELIIRPTRQFSLHWYHP